jgi:hypothetical protein
MVQCEGKRCGWQWSIDRIDNSKGHIIGNVRLTCFYCNVRQYGTMPTHEEAALMKRTKTCSAKCHIATVSRADVRLGHIAAKLKRTFTPSFMKKPQACAVVVAPIIKKPQVHVVAPIIKGSIARINDKAYDDLKIVIASKSGILITKRINNTHFWGRYGNEQNGFDVVVRSDGFINATEFANRSKKRISNWLENSGTKELIKELCTQKACKSNEIVCKVAGGTNTLIRGTYLHPLFIIFVASWISPKYALCVSHLADTFFRPVRECVIFIPRASQRFTDYKILQTTSREEQAVLKKAREEGYDVAKTIRVMDIPDAKQFIAGINAAFFAIWSKYDGRVLRIKETEIRIGTMSRDELIGLLSELKKNTFTQK